MIHKGTLLIKDAFDRVGLRYTMSEADDYSYLESNIKETNCTVELYFASADEQFDAKLLSKPIAFFPPEKLDAGLRLINEINECCRYAKFFINKLGMLQVTYDFPVETTEESLGSMAVELCVRITSTINDFYPDIMGLINS